MPDFSFDFIGFIDHGKGTKGGGGFAGIDEGGVVISGGDVLGVAEMSTTKDTV